MQLKFSHIQSICTESSKYYTRPQTAVARGLGLPDGWQVGHYTHAASKHSLCYFSSFSQQMVKWRRQRLLIVIVIRQCCIIIIIIIIITIIIIMIYSKLILHYEDPLVTSQVYSKGILLHLQLSPCYVNCSNNLCCLYTAQFHLSYPSFTSIS